jgi:hypothetical protein
MNTKKNIFVLITILISFSVFASPAYAASPDNDYTVVLRVHSPAARGKGVHIFDGSVVEARRSSDGKRVAVETADRSGRVVFKLNAGSYKFGPAEGLEKRLKGDLTLNVSGDLETDLELTLR